MWIQTIKKVAGAAPVGRYKRPSVSFMSFAAAVSFMSFAAAVATAFLSLFLFPSLSLSLYGFQRRVVSSDSDGGCVESIHIRVREGWTWKEEGTRREC